VPVATRINRRFTLYFKNVFVVFWLSTTESKKSDLKVMVNAVLAGTPKVTTDKLQRMLNACVVSGTHKFDRGLSRLLHTELHWLNVLEQVAFKLGLMVFSCLHQAPQYFLDVCQSVSSVTTRQHFRCANRGLLIVPCHRLSSYRRRAFSVAIPAIWNWLPDSLRDPAICSDSFRRLLKTFLFSGYLCT